MKNKPISEEEKAAIRVEVKQARKAGTPSLKAIAADHGIHPTMISKIAPNGTAKRKVARTAKTAKKTVKATAATAPVMYTEGELRQAYEEYISIEHALTEAWERVLKIAKGLPS